MRRRLLLLLPLPLLALAGCGNIAYQTRYVPRASELTWDEDWEQLPWQPPMRDDPDYPIHVDSIKPRWPVDSDIDVDKDPETFNWYKAPPVRYSVRY